MGIKTVPRPPYSRDLALCDFCLFPKLRGCRYETIEEIKEAVTKVIDTLTQEVFHGAFQTLFERYKKYIAVNFSLSMFNYGFADGSIDDGGWTWFISKWELLEACPFLDLRKKNLLIFKKLTIFESLR